MRRSATGPDVAQLGMPGMPEPPEHRPVASILSVAPGNEVVYQGYVSGGPHHGAKGVVRDVRGRRAVVDMGTDGVWHIPYYFLSIPRHRAA